MKTKEKILYKQAFESAAFNFAEAARLDDPAVYEAVLINVLSALPSWLENLQAGKNE